MIFHINMNKFCKLLGTLRVLKGFRQADIAYCLNTTGDKISHFEKGQTPRKTDILIWYLCNIVDSKQQLLELVRMSNNDNR